MTPAWGTQFVCALVGVLLAACAGDAGADGKDGKNGRNGENGKTGPAGAVGAAGPAGLMGEQGPKGEPGDDATGFRPLFWIGCERGLDLIGAGATIGTDGIVETGLDYTITVFSNEDVLVTCAESVGSAESAAGSAYYPGITVGSNTAGCSVTVDYPPLGDGVAGSWYYHVTSSGPRVRYSDVSSHPLHNSQYAFAENDCNVFKANAAGEWLDSSLNDAFGSE